MRVLTPRQNRVACDLVSGKSYAEVADSLGLSKDTIKSHAEEIYKRLEVSGVQELTRYYQMQFTSKDVGSLAGYWLSKFEFQSRSLSHSGARYTPGAQINLEYVTSVNEEEGYFTHRGVSLCSAPSTKLTFSHHFQFKKENQVLAGIWQNINTHNIGCMQLVVRNDHLGMLGSHLGTTSDLSVSSGEWVWRKVESPRGELVKPGEPTFRSIEQLDKFFAPTVDPREKIQLKELFQHMS